jgi:hypothetical protein
MSLYRMHLSKDFAVDTSNSARVHFYADPGTSGPKKMCSHFAQCSDLLLYFLYSINRDKEPTGANLEKAGSLSLR